MAATLTEATIEEIKSRIDLADLVASYGVQLKHSGASLWACCPFHNEKTPSFSVDRVKGFYHCFGCGESGDAIKFVEKMEGATFIDAVKKLAEQCGIKIEEGKPDPEAGKRKRLYALMGELAQFYHQCLLETKEAEQARQYLKTRALNRKVCDDFVIGYAPTGMATLLAWAEKAGYTPEELEEAGVIRRGETPGDLGYHRFAGRLMFTIKDKGGRVVAFSGRQLVEKKNSGKYVNSPETPIFKKSHVLFAFDKAASNIAKSPHREAIVCEGQIDTIRLHISGFPVAVASQGTAFTEEHVKLLKTVADSVVLVFDDDAAGHKATIRTARLFLAAGLPVRTVSLPDGNDPDSYLRTKGSAAFQTLLDAAQSIVAFQYRAARLAEKNPDSIDAVSRISKGLIETLAACASSVLKANLLGEAAKLLHVPTAALTDDLAKAETSSRSRYSRTRKTSSTTSPVPESAAPSEVGATPEKDDLPNEGINAADVIPPPPGESAFLGFLLSSEATGDVLEEIKELLPPYVLGHELSREVYTKWLKTISADAGEDMLAQYVKSLPPQMRAWFDSAFAQGPRGEASGLTALEMARGYIRNLWVAHLTRRRGELPAQEEVGEAARERLRLTMAISFIRTKSWALARENILKQLTVKEGELQKWT